MVTKGPIPGPFRAPLGDPFGSIGLFWPPVGPLWVRMWAKLAVWMDAMASLLHSFGTGCVHIVPMAPLRESESGCESESESESESASLTHTFVHPYLLLLWLKCSEAPSATDERWLPAT